MDKGVKDLFGSEGEGTTQVPRNALHTAHCTLHTAHCTLPTPRCTLTNVHYTLHIVHCTAPGPRWPGRAVPAVQSWRLPVRQVEECPQVGVSQEPYLPSFTKPPYLVVLGCDALYCILNHWTSPYPCSLHFPQYISVYKIIGKSQSMAKIGRMAYVTSYCDGLWHAIFF